MLTVIISMPFIQDALKWRRRVNLNCIIAVYFVVEIILGANYCQYSVVFTSVCLKLFIKRLRAFETCLCDKYEAICSENSSVHSVLLIIFCLNKTEHETYVIVIKIMWSSSIR